MNKHAILSEMGISTWSLAHAECLQGLSEESVEIPNRYKLLFVADSKPSDLEIAYLQKVLASMKLGLKDICHLKPHQLSSITSHNLQWLWVCRDENYQVPKPLAALSLLTSPSLLNLQASPQHRKSLWQQICSYDQT